MPRFFFNTNYGGVYVSDRVGTELEGRHLVRSEAITRAGEAIKALDGKLMGEDWHMSVFDEGGAMIIAVRFSALEFDHPTR